MKCILTTVFLFALFVSQAQISVRVRDNTGGRSVDVSARTGSSGNTNGNKSTGATPAGSSSSGTQPAKDTAAKPAGTAKPDEGYTGPAKVSLRSLWRQLDKLRAGDNTPSNVGNAERMLGQVKSQDPNYDVAALETEIAGYRAQLNNANAQAKNAADSKAEKDNYYRDFFQRLQYVYAKGITMESTGKEYYDRVQALDLPGFKQRRQQEGPAEPASFIAKLEESIADYDAYLTRSDRLKWNITERMVKARNTANPQEKMVILKEARYECEGVLIMSPNNAAFKQKLDELNRLLGAADAEASKYYTSDFHKEHVGTIVWSSKPLVIGKEKEMTAFIKNDFKTGEAIFGTAYLGNNIKDLLSGNERMRIIIKVDGGTAVWGGDLSYIIVPLAVQDKSYLQFALLPDEDWFAKSYAPYLAKENWTYSYFIDDLARAGDVSHSITCELEFPTNIQDDLKGAVNLDLANGSTALKALSAKLHDQLMASRQLPKAGMKNAALEQQMLAAANGLGWNDHFQKVIITSSAWVVSKNELTGAILYRYVGAVATTKSADGKCYYQEFGFRQDYTGGGNYSSTVKYNSYGSKREIGCDKL